MGAKLEVGALWYGEGYAGGEGGDFFAVALFAPHFALSADDVPDFFDGAVGDGDGYFSRGEFKVGHAAVFEFEEYADVGSIGCGDVGFLGQGFCSKFDHRWSPVYISCSMVSRSSIFPRYSQVFTVPMGTCIAFSISAYE